MPHCPGGMVVGVGVGVASGSGSSQPDGHFISFFLHQQHFFYVRKYEMARSVSPVPLLSHLPFFLSVFVCGVCVWFSGLL